MKAPVLTRSDGPHAVIGIIKFGGLRHLARQWRVMPWLLDNRRTRRHIVRRIAVSFQSAAIAVFALSANPAIAQDRLSDSFSENADTITVGLGIGLTPSYDGARNYRMIPGGILGGTIAGHDFRLNGPQIFIDTIPNNLEREIEIEFGPIAGIAANRNGNVSDERVAALGKLKIAVELGASGAIGRRGILNRTDKLALAVTAVWDVAGAHNSHVISPAVQYSTMIGRGTFLRVAVTSEFVGDRYARYNFEVTPTGSVASGLAIYEPNGGLASLGANALTAYSLSGERTGWSIFGFANFKRLQGDIADSPIVTETGSPNQFFAFAGLAYTF